MAADDLEGGEGSLPEDLLDAAESLLHEDSDPGMGDLEIVYESLGLETVSHLYGLASREEQFQELYQAFRRYNRYQSGGFRESHHRSEEVYNDLIDAFENYMGPVSDETKARSTQTAASIVQNQEIAHALANLVGQVTADDLRDILVDVRETVKTP